MVSTVLPLWGVAFLLSVSCWSVGRFLLSADRPVAAMLCGWCVFLTLCSVPWIFGLPTNVVSPLFWLFAVAGLGLAVRGRQWTDLAFAAIATGVVTAIIGSPFVTFPGLLAYGAHGLDMWGYVITADWLQYHSIHQLPELGVTSMRFNWTWHVLVMQDRPLTYESLACLGSASGLGPAKAYVAYPITLLASLAMALAREPGVFRLKHAWLALVPTLILVFHPLVILTWIAGFYGGSVTALFAALAFAGAALPGDARTRRENLALAVLMFVFCGALYTVKFLYVGLAVAAAPLLVAVIIAALKHDFSPLAPRRPSPVMTGLRIAIATMTLAVIMLGHDQRADTGEPQLPIAAAGHVLGIFGGTSPYVWIGYTPGGPFDRNPIYNPIGSLALVVMLTLLILLSWSRWKKQRDVQIPVLVGLCAGMIWLSAGDELIMAKTLVIFGFALVVVFVAVSSELEHFSLGVLALIVCCLPALRSAVEVKEMLENPFIRATEETISNAADGQDWLVLSYLHFREDQDGFDWTAHPRMYSSVTHFLPLRVRMRLAERYHMPPP